MIENIIILLNENLYMKDFFSLLKINKSCYKINNMKIINMKKKDYFNKINKYNILKMNMNYIFFNEIKNIFGNYVENYKYLLNGKLLNLDSLRGISGYIDFISELFFDNTNILYGYDIYNRFYISLLYDKNDKKRNIITFFQRYSDDINYYVNCGNSFLYGITTHNFSLNKIKDMQFIILFNLLQFGYMEYETEDNFIINFSLSDIS